ncbi:hypothetical protein [Aquimarina macrocephali]|uniref:hypothetical protein n=1 Tax=Aquimarina macrocephali TaxID=666563 RepID=UPI000465263F|nr:hypothetical protein [Aquimarina macrocephali]
MNRKQQDYNQAINLISHLILTKPQSVVSLLRDYGVGFSTIPNRKQLIGAVVELMKDRDPKFIDDLGDLVTVHIQKNGKEMLQLQDLNYSSYVDEEDEDEFWGALAKGAIGIVGSLFGGGKKKKRRRAANHAAAQAASKAEAQKASQQAQRARMDMERRMQEMQARQREREERQRAEMRRQQEEQKRKEEARIREMKEAAKKSKNNILMIAGGLGVIAIVGIGMVVSKKSSPVPIAYAPPVAPIAR